MTERKMGVLLLFLGAALLYLAVIDPLTSAEESAAEVALALKAAFVVPLALVYGIAYTFFTERATRLLGTRTKPTTVGWVAIVLLVGAGVLLHVLVRWKLEEMGYRFD